MRKPTKARLDVLADDLNEPLDPSALAEVTMWLDSYTVAEPAPAATKELINRVRACVPAPARHRFRDEGLAPWTFRSYLTHLAASARLMGRSWWVVTAALALLGLRFEPWLAGSGIPIAAISSPLVIAGIMYGFRTNTPVNRAVELSCPVHPATLILTRALLVIGWIFGLGLLPAALLGGEMGLLVDWAAATIFFGGLTVCLTFWVGPRIALLLTMTIWALGLGLATAVPPVTAPHGTPEIAIVLGFLLLWAGARAGCRTRTL